MIGTLVPPADERAWRIGAYALATLIHLPLILAVQEFGTAIAAARPPVESVVTLLDTPETARVTAVDTSNESAGAATLGGGKPATPRSSARIDQRADAAVIAPTPMTDAAEVVAPEAQSIEDLIASDTSVSALDVRPTVSRPIASTATTPVDSPTPQPPRSIAAAPAAVAPAPAAVPPGPEAATAARALATIPAEVATAGRVEPLDTQTSVAALTARSPVSLPLSASSVPPTRPSTVAAEIPDLAAPRATAVSEAPQPLPRITIPATGARAAAEGGGRVTVAEASPAAFGGSVRSTAVAASSAPVSSPVGDVSQPVHAVPPSPAPTVANTVTSPPPGALGTAVRVAPVRLPAPPLRTAAIPPDAAGPDRAALNAFVRGYQGGGCFAALTIASTGEDVALSGFSRDETALAGFQDALGRREGPRPAAAGRKVSEAQCSVLAFARSQAAYPDFPVRLRLETDRIASGGIIGGRVEGAGDRPVTLLILDDEGRIQDATFLLARQPSGDWTFRTPLSLTGSPVPTVQLFVALAGDGPIAALRPPVPVEARRYFTEIDRILDARRQSLDVALAAFTVDAAKAQP